MRGTYAGRSWSRHAPAIVLVAVLVVAAPVTQSSQRVYPYRLGAGAVITDVAVYGATPGGIIAAVAAARSGASVALVAPSAHVGGMMTSGLSYTDIGDKSTLGGYTKEFFDRVEAIEGVPDGRYAFEPHVAERVFTDMLRSAGVAVYLRQRLDSSSVRKDGTRVVSFTTSGGKVFGAFVFIDASYAGDLLAAAGVSTTVGRESVATYGESLAGIQPAHVVTSVPAGILFEPSTEPPAGPVGAADHRVQDANYRVCFSSDPANQVPFTRPAGYDPDRYALVGAYLRAREQSTGKPAALSWELSLSPLPNHKYDVNSAGYLSIALTGTNYAWPTGSAETRAAIASLHEAWERGLLYYLANDPGVPATLRLQLDGYGLCRDEFTDNGNWPYQLYEREGRRMIGAYVLTQADVATNRSKPDVIGFASYRVDAHGVSRWIDGEGRMLVEGSIGLPYRDWAIPYRSLVPRAAEVANLLVTNAISASHVAYASFRMEPQFMLAGEAAGTAAWMALPQDARGRPSVQSVGIRALQSLMRARGSVLALPPLD